MHYQQTLMTTLQDVMCISQLYAFLDVTKALPEWPDPPSACWCCNISSAAEGVVWSTRLVYNMHLTPTELLCTLDVMYFYSLYHRSQATPSVGSVPPIWSQPNVFSTK